MNRILVTGANKGIGLAVVEAILKEQPGCGVILGARDFGRGAAARDALLARDPEWSGRLRVLELDVADDDSVARAAEVLSSDIIDNPGEVAGLVNNAGIGSGSLAAMLEVNAYGVQRVTGRFAPLICAGGRVVNVTSASGPNYVAECSAEWRRFFLNDQVEWAEIDEFMRDCLKLSPAELYARGLVGGRDYGFSKACANLCSLFLARTYPNLIVNACTPGYIETDMTREMTRGSGKTAAELGMKQPADGARVVMHLLFDEVTGSGHYYGSDSLRSPLDRYRAPGSPAYAGD